jgi:hypothetical protein
VLVQYVVIDNIPFPDLTPESTEPSCFIGIVASRSVNLIILQDFVHYHWMFDFETEVELGSGRSLYVYNLHTSIYAAHLFLQCLAQMPKIQHVSSNLTYLHMFHSPVVTLDATDNDVRMESAVDDWLDYGHLFPDRQHGYQFELLQKAINSTEFCSGRVGKTNGHFCF